MLLNKTKEEPNHIEENNILTANISPNLIQNI